MKLKTLLLSSAAVFTVVGGAQAADLTVAEPVDYVQVCDAFGTGYWYIPGTTTCINIGGEVTFDINFHENKSVMDGSYYWEGNMSSGSFDYWGYGNWNNGSPSSNHSAGWDFVTGAKVSVTAKSATEYGDLTAYVKMAAKSDNSNQTMYVSDTFMNSDPGLITQYSQLQDGKTFSIDEAWLQLGMVTAGYLHSAYDWKGGYIGTAIRGDEKVDQLRFTWAMGGFGLILSVEDPRDRWGTTLPGGGGNNLLPEIAGAITASQGIWSGQLSAIVGQVGCIPWHLVDVSVSCSSGALTVWGVNGGIEIDANPVSVRLAAAVGTGTSYVGGGTNGVTNWSAFASAKAPLTSTLDIAGMISYLWDGTTLGFEPASGGSKWAAAGGLIWSPVSEFSVEGRVTWTQKVGSTGSWGGRIELKRKFGAD